MKEKMLLSALFVFLMTAIIAQDFQNEWIDYNKTYYRIKAGPFGYDIVSAPIKKGAVRITQPALVSMGLQNVPAEHFQLWREGREIPVYISKENGILSSTDYIEFWGEIANGKPDTKLYEDPAYQLSDYWSLSTDSATYFLTVNTAGTNKRFVNAVNDISGQLPEPEKNFMYTTGRYYRTFINSGFGAYLEQKLYTSTYGSGEGFTSRPVRNNYSSFGQGQMPQTFPALQMDTTGPPVTARYFITGNAPNYRNVKILLNNDSLAQFSLDYFTYEKKVFPGIPSNQVKNDTATFTVINLASEDDDELRVAAIEMTYPRKFNFGGAAAFEFDMEASASGRYLKIANFSRGSGDAVLYDITNGKRYVAITSITDTLQFFLQPSAAIYNLVLVRGDGSAAQKINTAQERRFINFLESANQGNYLIISNPLLYGSGNENYIEQYADYRRSDSGGNFNVKIIDIFELQDQFAYGIEMHPAGIKNFLSYARNKFVQLPDFVFLIGKGVTYASYRFSAGLPLTAKLNLVPVYGSPGSDNLLSSDGYDAVPQTPIGRLSAVTPAEVGTYLAKMKEYERQQRDTSDNIADKAWMKKVLHLTGANDPRSAYLIDSNMVIYNKIISDTLFGGNVHSYSKSADPDGYQQDVLDFTNQFNGGTALLQYFGHSSSSSIDFSLDNPANYRNNGKYPVFIVNGCLAGNIFDYDANRFNNRSTFSEKFIFEPGLGAIGYLSTSNYGMLDFLAIFTQNFYKSMSATQYGSSFGRVLKEGFSNAKDYIDNDIYAKMHAEQITFHGDPALKLNSYPLPDYAIDSSQISITPGYLNVVTDSFSVKLKIHNLGKALNDSLHFTLQRTYPDGNSATVFSGNIGPVKALDSLTFTLPVVANRDKGTTILTATVNEVNQLPELSAGNNRAVIKIKISAADLIPVSPYNYSIVHTKNIDIAASTAYAYSGATGYVLEMDTTALFDSPAKMTRQQVSTGGLVEFKNIQLDLDNTVYYWRVAEDSASKHWNSFSFVYRDAGNSGFEQAHFYQHTESSLSGMTADSLSRSFGFDSSENSLFIVHSIYPTSGLEDAQFSIAVNGSIISWSACVGSSIIFNVFDPRTFKPVLNTTLPYGAGAICDPMRKYNFEYSTQSATTRKNAMDFLDYYVQNGYYVVARKIYDMGNADWAPSVWARDTSVYGHNNSLYHRLKDQGTMIDSFTYPRTFIFVFKKNDSTSYKPVSMLSQGLYDRITLSETVPSYDTTGYITSPKFGPGKSWNRVKWNGKAANNYNKVKLEIFAVDKNGKDSLFFTIDTSQHELNISAISAAEYPYVQLRMHTQDSVEARPYQLNEWGVEFEPVPEGAISANLGSNIPDTLRFYHPVHTAFDTLKGSVVFKNISSAAFDSLKVKLLLYDKADNVYPFEIPKTKPLNAGDTVHISFMVNVAALPEGTYNLYLEVNPDNDQPEQYHYNNFLYKYVTILRESVLAASFFDLTAKPLGKAVDLQWTVKNEAGVAYYQPEFSTDGIHFTGIGKVNASVADQLNKKYSFLHTSPVNGKNYYRVKMINKNGNYAYTPVRMIPLQQIHISVYPNPFKHQLNINCNVPGIRATVSLLDLTGKTLMRQKFTESISLRLGNLANGIYIVQVNDGQNMYAYKVVKE